jgi:hypothetical protein
LYFSGFFRLTIPNSAPLVYGTKVQSRLTPHIGAGALAAATAAIMNFRRLKDRFPKKNRPPDEEEAGHLTKLVLVLEMEPHTRAH